MKILWVKAGGLVPPDTGGKIRSYNILRELARRHSVTFFSFYSTHTGDVHPSLSDVFDRVVCVPLSLPKPTSPAELRDHVIFPQNPTASRSIAGQRCGAGCTRCSTRKPSMSSFATSYRPPDCCSFSFPLMYAGEGLESRHDEHFHLSACAPRGLTTPTSSAKMFVNGLRQLSSQVPRLNAGRVSKRGEGARVLLRGEGV
jgi:hypothetical protein